MTMISGGAIFESVGLLVGFSGQSAYQNVPYAKIVFAVGGVAPYTFSIVVGSLPTGLSISSSTGVISGTPTGTGISNFTVSVQDSANGLINFATSITVYILSSIALTPNPVTVAIGATNQLTATGTWSDSTTSNITGLASWASSDATKATVGTGGTNNGLVTGVAAGTPTITASFNSITSPTDTVTVPSGTTNPTFATTSLPHGQINSLYPENSGVGFQLSCTGGSGGAPYTFTKHSGSFQTGLSLSSGGLISGTPTASGTQALTFTCTDSASNTSAPSSSLNLVVASVLGVALNPSVATLAIGQQLTPTCTVNFSDSTTIPCPATTTSLATDGGCSDFTGTTYTAFTCAGISQGSLTVNVVANQVLVVLVNYGGATAETLSVSDSLSNTWHAIGSKQTGNLLGAWQMFYSVITNAGSTTISGNASVATGYPTVLYILLNGISSSTILDPNGANPTYTAQSGPGTSCSTGITTSNASDVIIEFCLTTNNPLTFTPGTGYTQAITDPVNAGVSSEYSITSATQSAVSVTQSFSLSSHWAGAVVAFEQASPGTGWTVNNGDVTVSSTGTITGVATGSSTVSATYGGQSGNVIVTVPTSTTIPSYVQSNWANVTGTTSTVANTLGSSTPAGNLLLVWIDYDCGGGCATNRSLTSITDDIGNVYTKIQGPFNYLSTGAGDTAVMYWAINNTAGVRTVTAVASASPNGTFMGSVVAEYTNVGSTPINASTFNCAIASPNPPTAGCPTNAVANPSSSVTTTTPNTLVVGIYGGGGTVAPTAGSGFTLETVSNYIGGATFPFGLQDASFASNGTINVPWTDAQVQGTGLWNIALTSGSSQGVTQVNVIPLGTPTSPYPGNDGSTVQFIAQDQNGNQLSAAWTTSSPSVATVNGSTGLASCVTTGTGTATITATYQTLSGQSVLQCSPVSTTSLLTGCTVSSSNAVQTCTKSYPPAGWTPVVAQGFDAGSLPASQFASGTIGPANGTTCHTGANCLGSFVTNDQAGAFWELLPGNIGSFASVYLSFYEWLDSNAVVNDELFVANLSQHVSGSLVQEMIIDRFNFGPTYNITNPYVSVEVQSNGGGGVTHLYGGPSPLNLSAGAWHQWEIMWTPNTGSCSVPSGNGSVVIYRDGSQYTSISGVCLNGSASMTNGAVQAGGLNTKNIWESSTGSCVGLGAGPTEIPGNGRTFAQIAAICPPLNPSYNRYIDDIIVLKK